MTEVMTLEQQEQLLRKHRPVLVILPRDTGRKRPGDLDAELAEAGDYHPCSAEFFLSQVYRRKKSPGFAYARLLIWRDVGDLPLTNIEDIKKDMLDIGQAEDTRQWELDISKIPSHDATAAWKAYATLLNEGHGQERAVYARYVPAQAGGTPPLLQYWYLYLYNDFSNNHEADWEMITIEMTTSHEPSTVGLSSHHGGMRRGWHKVTQDGDRPIVHVARGSHANYFAYKAEGYEVLDLSFASGFGRRVNSIISWIKKTVLYRTLLIDTVVDDPKRRVATAAPTGVRIDPTLHVLPDDIDSPPDKYWWLRYRGRWGSGRPRFVSEAGIATPWRAPDPEEDSDYRWHQPHRWLNECRHDEP